jgi:hypothetical protein
MLTDIAISEDRNATKKGTKNVSKYKDFSVEIQCMWTVETNVVPITTGSTGTISKSFRKYLKNVPGRHIRELQRTAILATAHVLFGELM